jgi:hypothetical protein
MRCATCGAGISDGTKCISCPSSKEPDVSKVSIAEQGSLAPYCFLLLLVWLPYCFFSFFRKTACIDIDECAVDNGGCDEKMGSVVSSENSVF